jgi:hypothetical protein
MPKKSEKPISLRPLSFNEAVADLLKVKPQEKPQRKRAAKKKRAPKR